MCFWNDNLDNDWFIDSGATAHITKNGNLFSKSSRCNEQIRIADGSIPKAVTIGDIDAFKKLDDGSLSFEDVLYRQQTIQLSTTEAEYMAVSATTQKVIWMRGLKQELQPYDRDYPTKIYCDIQSPMQLGMTNSYHIIY